MNFLKKIKISKKVYGGFGVVVLLLGIIAGVAYTQFETAKENFVDYRSLARQTNQSGRIQANLLEARMQVKNYIINQSEESVANLKDRAGKTLEFLNEGAKFAKESYYLKEIGKADEISKQLSIEAEDMQKYIHAFEEVMAKQALRNEIVNGKLNVAGPAMEKALTSIMESAFRDGDAEAAYRAGLTLRNVLLARLYTAKFLIENDQASFDRAISENAALEENQKLLEMNLQNPTRKELARTVEVNHTIYENAIPAVKAVIDERNAIISKELDVIGPEVAGTVEDIKLTLLQEQDALGPRAQASISNASNIIVVAALLSLTFAVLAATLIGRGISVPINSMTGAMNDLAGGDKSIEIPAQDHKDEIGEMAKAVQVFKENMIKADELSAQQREEERLKEIESKRVSALIRDFEVTMVTVLDSLNEADTSMRAASTQVKSTSDKTKEESASVAAASEQATRNVEAVASAADELSSSINEISRQVTQANEVSSNAVSRANDTSTQIKVLEENVAKISEIVDLINSIADQTNLLALNATIEAARAGDAGKGFAVVASEVKNLANQTSRATEEISAQISQVQQSTQGSVNAIEGISTVIREISEISTMISSSVEEQGAATQEIARNVEEAAIGTRGVSSSINDVLGAAEESNLAASSIATSSDTLTEQTVKLQDQVSHFLSSVQNGGGDENAELLSWTNEFEAGVANIDAQHRHLFDMINNIYKNIKSGARDSVSEQEIEKIAKHYGKHFSTEEEFMANESYPALAAHKKAHDEFMARVTELQNAKNNESELQVLSMMASWWKKHFPAHDKPLVQFAQKQPGGMKLQA